MLSLAITVKLLAEIALLALLAQAVVGVLSGAAKDHNPVYRLLQVIGKPWMRVARWLSPRVVLDRHLPFLAFFALLLVWVAASLVKVRICLQIGVALCQ